MNILLVSKEFPPHNGIGGVGSYMKNLSVLLTQYGHVVFVFSGINEEYSKIELNVNNNLSIYKIPCSSDNDFIRKSADLYEKIKNEIKIDVIESPEVGACALEIKRRNSEIPLVVKLHTPVSILAKTIIEFSPIYVHLRYFISGLVKLKIRFYHNRFKSNKINDAEYQICNMADILYSPSLALALRLKKYWNLEKDVTIIPNPININEVVYENRNLDNDFKICFIGKLSFLKGTDVFFQAIRVLLKTHTNIKVEITGDDQGDLIGVKYLEKYKDLLRRYSTKISVQARVSNEIVEKQLQNNDVIIVPSLWENYPTIILEAVKNGCMVIASDVGGISEIIENGVSGLLFKVNSVSDLTRKIESVINKRTLVNELSLNAFKSLQRKLDNKNIYEQVEDLYKKIL